jgi:predicted O-methyltransferase YrrM
VTAAERTLSGARAGLAAGLVTAVPFGVLAAVVVALGHASGGEALLLVLAVFFTVASLATVVNSRTLLLRLELRAMRMEGLSVPGVAALGGGYPLPLGIGFPMDPPALAELARIVSERQPETIVELGSGISSLVMGLTLRRLGRGHVTTYDHDLDWADETRRRVAALGLSDLVTVVHAPLVEVEVEGTRRPWYGLADALPGKPIDLLVVDGPPGTTGGDGLARWPAFPMLASHLSDGAVVFVDDVSRKDESTMVRRWLAGTSGWKSRRVLTEHGVAVLERVPSK